MGNDDPEKVAEANLFLENASKKIIHEFKEMTDEDFNRLVEDADEEEIPEIVKSGEMTRTEIVDFFEGFRSFTAQKQRIESELRDVSEFEDDEWKDGFDFFDRIAGESEIEHVCSECDGRLDRKYDDLRVAEDGAIIYTYCSSCGENTIEDHRSTDKMFQENRPPLPDESIQLKIDDDVKDLFQDSE